MIEPADDPAISLTLDNLLSIVFKCPKSAKKPIAPGPITRYSMSLNKTEEIAFVKERTRVRKRPYELMLPVDSFALT